MAPLNRNPVDGVRFRPDGTAVGADKRTTLFVPNDKRIDDPASGKNSLRNTQFLKRLDGVGGQYESRPKRFDGRSGLEQRRPTPDFSQGNGGGQSRNTTTDDGKQTPPSDTLTR